jgi:NitT/TauT family transport system substrate-binding protein
MDRRRPAEENGGVPVNSAWRGYRRTFLYLFISAALLISLTVSCSKEQRQAPAHISYRLKWLLNISVVGDLYAEAQGYFAGQGLAVEIKPGSPEQDAIKELELGRAQFGVASADQIIRALAKGAPIVVIAQLFQTNPLQWIYRFDTFPLINPRSLKGRTIGITHGGNDETIMKALLTQYAIDDNEVTFYSVRYDYTPFYQKEVALWPVYRNAEGIVIAGKLRAEGEEVGFFDPAAHGIRFVANSVITSREMLRKHPATVKKFGEALLRGWREALDEANAAKALATMRKYDHDTPDAILQKQLTVTRELMAPPESAFGTINVAAWRQTEQIMLQQGLIASPVVVEQYLYPLRTIAAGE